MNNQSPTAQSGPSAENMAAIGAAFMEQLKKSCPYYQWKVGPEEIIERLIEERLEEFYKSHKKSTRIAELELAAMRSEPPAGARDAVADALEALAVRFDKRDQWMRTKTAPNIGLADAFKDAAADIRALVGKADGAHGHAAASDELAAKEVLVPCDCGCGRQCCAMCGNDLGFIAEATQPAATGMGDAIAETPRTELRRLVTRWRALAATWADIFPDRKYRMETCANELEVALAAQPAPVDAERGLRTNRREQAVQHMLGEGWKWDGAAWCREPTAQPAPVVGGDAIAKAQAWIQDFKFNATEDEWEICTTILELLAARPVESVAGRDSDAVIRKLRCLGPLLQQLNAQEAAKTVADAIALLAARPGGDARRKKWYDEGTPVDESQVANQAEAHPAQAGGEDDPEMEPWAIDDTRATGGKGDRP